MLVANLNFYPDSRKATDCARIGLLIFQYQASKGLVGFIEWKDDLARVRGAVADPTLRAILDAPGPFVRRLGASAPADGSELTLANTVAAGLPYNLSITEPHAPQPPEMEELFALVAAAEADNRFTFADAKA